MFVAEDGSSSLALIRWFIEQILTRWIVVAVFFVPVFCNFLFSIFRLRREIRACTRWSGSAESAEKSRLAFFLPILNHLLLLASRVKGYVLIRKRHSESAGAVGKSDIVRELEVFLEEADRWRVQGVVLPLSDYSDRIDSLIEGLVDRLHNAVNLFLVAGLAGTFFGMAEFAR